MPRGNVESVQNDFSNDDVKTASVRLRRRRGGRADGSDDGGGRERIG